MWHLLPAAGHKGSIVVWISSAPAHAQLRGAPEARWHHDRLRHHRRAVSLTHAIIFDSMDFKRVSTPRLVCYGLVLTEAAVALLCLLGLLLGDPARSSVGGDLLPLPAEVEEDPQVHRRRESSTSPPRSATATFLHPLCPDGLSRLCGPMAQGQPLQGMRNVVLEDRAASAAAWRAHSGSSRFAGVSMTHHCATCERCVTLDHHCGVFGARPHPRTSPTPLRPASGTAVLRARFARGATRILRALRAGMHCRQGHVRQHEVLQDDHLDGGAGRITCIASPSCRRVNEE